MLTPTHAALAADLTPAAAPARPPQPQRAAGDASGILTQLLEHAQSLQDGSLARFDQRLQDLDTGRLSTSDMLRLQGDMGEFAVRTSMTVRIADTLGSAIQTLTQRS